MVISLPSSSLKSLARPDLDNVDGGRPGAGNLVGDVLALDVRLVPQRQHDRPDHGNQQHHAGRLEEIDIARVENVPERLGIEHAGDRRNWRRDRALHVGTDCPGDQHQHQLDEKNAAEKGADRQVLHEPLSQLGEIDVEHHHHEQEQHQYLADIDFYEYHRQFLRAQENEHGRRVDEGVNEEQHRMHGIPRRNDHDGGGDAHAGKQVEKQRGEDHSTASPVRRIERDVVGDLALPAVAVREQALLVEVKLLARLGGELEVRPFDDGVDRAGFLAKPAVDAFDHIDVIARGAARPVIATRPRLDGDRLRRTDRLAEFAGDTALLAVGIAAQRVLAAKARRDVPLLERIVERGLRLEEIT